MGECCQSKQDRRGHHTGLGAKGTRDGKCVSYGFVEMVGVTPQHPLCIFQIGKRFCFAEQFMTRATSDTPWFGVKLLN